MIFAPNIMAHFPVEVMPTNKGKLSLFHPKGRIQTLAPLLAEIVRSTKLDSLSPSWVGLHHRETREGMLTEQRCKTALEAFERAEAKLNAPLLRDRPQLSVIGSSFSMGRVMQGHPVQCFRRPKHKLPPRHLDLEMSYTGGTDAALVTASIAKIVRAAHEYHIAGGAITLTVHYMGKFNIPNPETRAQGICLSLDIPLGQGSLASFAGSAQIDRGIFLPIATALSGKIGDSIPALSLNIPGIARIAGQAQDAKDVIASLKIQ